MSRVQDYLEAYDTQLRTDAETPSAVSVTRLGPLRLVTFPGGRGFVTYRDLADADESTISRWVERVVEQEQATALLLDLSTRAQLLVLGRSSRGALLGLVVGSPTVDLLGAAHSPLLVVPAAGPPRSTWWPTASSRRTRAGG